MNDLAMSEPEKQVLVPSEINNTMDATKVFFTSPLDSTLQRKALLEKVHEYLTEEKQNVACEVIYLGQVEWESVGQVSSLTCFVMSLCRKFNLMSSERTILLSLHDQYQAIQLCLARINKKKHGEFMAAASDVLDIWNELYRTALNSNFDSNEGDDDNDEILPSARRASYDPVVREMTEITQDYREFMKDSGCLDHFIIYSCLKKNIKQNQELLKDIFSKVYIIEGVNQMPVMERELLKLLLNGSQIFKLSSEFPVAHNSVASDDFNISGIFENDVPSSVLEDGDTKVNELHDHSLNEAMTVEVGIINSSLTDYVNNISKSPCKTHISSDSKFYIEQLIFAHLRLLINTRDELALTLVCNMPGREITQQGFTDIRLEAQKKNMPMYQTVLSFIMRQRLGGKGYQADRNNPVLLHVKPLGEVVDSIMKLQNIVEEEPDTKKGALKVMSTLKTNLIRMQGCVFKRSTVEKVWNGLNSALVYLLNAIDEASEPKVHPNNIQTTGSLRPCLKHLIRLCDEAGGHVHDEGIVDALGENFLTQCSSARKCTTPVRIPTVLSLFRSPAEGVCENMDAADTGEDDSLRMRLLKKSGFGATPVALPERHHSGCEWAPDSLSPVSKGTPCHVPTSPITGPTLKVLGMMSKSSQHWRDIVESVSQSQREETDIAETSLPKNNKGAPASKKFQNKNTLEKSSKRSLLSDISNISKESKCKKQKSSFENKPKKCATVKKGTLPKGQKPITSFFKM
ncbi:PCNA-interacting partner isoform X2 [Procambarus clarkii]|uniref:PCNA-interacting partner isoform X2 n=1 Tax=Procambarus clarkii TaxID=6728 RepID=UPI001E67319D|nr:PCNA-interacting partner-like isoform X2 [Procambarus clarkii]